MPTIFRNAGIDERLYYLLLGYGWDDETILLWITNGYQADHAYPTTR